MWGVNGVANIIYDIGTVGSAATGNALLLGAVIATESPEFVVAAGLALTVLDALVYYIAKAEFSIASKSFKHMGNTLF